VNRSTAVVDLDPHPTRASRLPAARRLDAVPFSPVRQIFDRVSQLERDGASVIHLEIGRPDFDTPKHIKQAAYRALAEGQVHYTSNYGVPPLREAIAHKLRRDNHIEYDPRSEIVVTAGVSEGIMAAMLALLDPGDEVLIPEPVFPPFEMAARIAGAVPVPVHAKPENGYQPTRLDCEQRVSDRTRMLVVVTPGNPSGVVYTEGTLRALAGFAVDHDLLVVSDEIYEQLIYDGRRHVSCASLPGMRARTVTLNGFSKSYAMTGWRLGYMAADAKLVGALLKVHQYSVVCACSVSQWAGFAALEGPQDCLRDMVAEFDRRRRLLVERLRPVKVLCFPEPQGALYAYLDVSGLGATAEQLASDLLEEARVAVVPWGTNHLRISYANSYDNLDEALTRIVTFIDRHQSAR
jgi:aspartate/methionine/tyrosine aminotransferase